jgi:hypothetical protein
MLTEYEKSAARHDGGKALGNRKRHLAQIKSALLTLCGEADAGMNHLAGFNAKEITTLREAAHVVARIEAAYEKDAKAAKTIKAGYDTAIKAASQALRGLVHDPIGDVIALLAIANPRNEHAAIKDILDGANDTRGAWQWRLDQMQRDAVSELAYQIAWSGQQPSVYCAALDLQSAKDRHASVIAQVKAIAVAQKLQATA